MQFPTFQLTQVLLVWPLVPGAGMAGRGRWELGSCSCIPAPLPAGAPCTERALGSGHGWMFPALCTEQGSGLRARMDIPRCLHRAGTRAGMFPTGTFPSPCAEQGPEQGCSQLSAQGRGPGRDVLSSLHRAGAGAGMFPTGTFPTPCTERALGRDVPSCTTRSKGIFSGAGSRRENAIRSSSLLLFTEHVSQTLKNAICDAEYRAVFLCPRIELYQNEISCSFEPVSIATVPYTCDVQAEAATTSEPGRTSLFHPPWKAEGRLWCSHGTFCYMLPMPGAYVQSVYSGLPYLHLVNKYKCATYMKLYTCKNSIYSCPEGRLYHANVTQNKSLCSHL